MDARPVRRVAVFSVHTSPLHQPGTGDAGGMNVYIAEVARELAEAGVEVEIFTRATSSDLPPIVPLAPGGAIPDFRKLVSTSMRCGTKTSRIVLEIANRGPASPFSTIASLIC